MYILVHPALKVVIPGEAPLPYSKSTVTHLVDDPRTFKRYFCVDKQKYYFIIKKVDEMQYVV